jgi:DNA/RNA-binding domain of Phe-tRNA-synthetase-like protein
MLEVYISDELKSIWSDVALGCIEAEVKIRQYDSMLWEEIKKYCKQLKEQIIFKRISSLPNNKESREAYRRFGKDPTRYRLSSESLLRRILKNKGLYQINNIVDLNNLLSMTSFYSVGTYDIEKLKPPIIFRVGKKNEDYIGIGRGALNIEDLPVLSDQISAFGSATSDSERTMITKDTKKILMNIISFNGSKNLSKYIEYGKNLLEKYADSRNIESKIIL